MLAYKKISTILAFCLVSTSAFATEDTGYYVFGMSRYFSPKIGANEAYDGIDIDNKSVSRFYPSIDKNNYNYLRDTGRTFKEAMSYGDWNKPYRVMMGSEYDLRLSKTSSGTYGSRSNSASAFLLADKAYFDNFWRFGGGVALINQPVDYDNGIKYHQQGAIGSLYAIYNDAKNQIRLRSRFYVGYGDADIKRLSQSGTHKSEISNTYFGTEHSLSQTFEHQGFFVQPTVELEAYSIHRGKLEESSGYQLGDRSTFRLNGLVGLYAGIKGKDVFGNSYNFKVGPDITYLFSNPYEDDFAYSPSGDEIYFKKGTDKKDVIAWKAYLTYSFQNGLGIYSDARYYHKGYQSDDTSFALGINYKF